MPGSPATTIEAIQAFEDCLQPPGLDPPSGLHASARSPYDPRCRDAKSESRRARIRSASAGGTETTAGGCIEPFVSTSLGTRAKHRAKLIRMSSVDRFVMLRPEAIKNPRPAHRARDRTPRGREVPGHGDRAPGRQAVHSARGSPLLELRREPSMVDPNDGAPQESRPPQLADLISLCRSLNREAAAMWSSAAWP